jgi:putative ABC transport system permease protein
MVEQFLLVVKDENILENMVKEFIDDTEVQSSMIQMITMAHFDLNGTEKNKKDFILAASGALEDVANNTEYIVISTKQDLEEEMRSFAGGFLFIGILFSVSFILATALIIYYKQLSEGKMDKGRFEILQKVGMSHKEVKKTINSQILMVFFLPIAVAVIHLIVALPMLFKCLKIFAITDIWVLIGASGGAVVGTAIIYYLIYMLTSKVYYKLVER